MPVFNSLRMCIRSAIGPNCTLRLFLLGIAVCCGTMLMVPHSVSAARSSALAPVAVSQSTPLSQEKNVDCASFDDDDDDDDGRTDGAISSTHHGDDSHNSVWTAEAMVAFAARETLVPYWQLVIPPSGVKIKPDLRPPIRFQIDA